MFCRKCGKELESGNICAACSRALDGAGTLDAAPQSGGVSSDGETKASGLPSLAKPFLSMDKTTRIIVIVAAFAVCAGLVFMFGYFATRCQAEGCNNTAELGRYCARHVCLYPGCERQRTSSSQYCYMHEGYDDSSDVGTTSGSGVSTGKSNALSKAKSYLRSSAFSRKGLIEQLEFEGFSEAEATYAVDNCGADWNEQAVKKAKSYLKSSSFSRKSLIEQLEFEGFTHSQAEHGVSGAGY